MVKTVAPVLVLVLVATVLATNPPGQPVATSAPGSPVAGASPTTGASPTPGPDGSPAPTLPPEPWEDLVLGPIEVVASITPNRQDRLGVATTSGFTLRSLGDAPAAELAKGVVAHPPLKFRVRPGAAKDEVILDPVEALLEDTTYRLTLTRGDGGLGGTWAFRTQRPLYIVTTIPGDEETEVPVDTGIEVTFDQDGSVGLEDHFTIEPAVAGRFEQHGRTWAFVPDEPLRHASAYRVTVTPGVGLEGSELQLETKVSFVFETEPAPGPREARVSFSGPLAAVRPDQEAALLIETVRRSDRPDTFPTRIYALPDFAATLDAAERLTGPDRWLRVSGEGLVDTSRLDRIASLNAPVINAVRQAAVLTIPVRLDPGAYVVEVPRRTGAAQLLLQVSYLSAYAVSTDTRSVVWVNNLSSVAPVVGATVSLPKGRDLDTTNNGGVAEFATPAELVPRRSDGKRWEPPVRLMAVRAPDGRAIVVALGSPVSYLDGEFDSQYSLARELSQQYWLLLETDREDYRQTDTINVWGMVRPRAGSAAPRSAELQLRPGAGNSDAPDLAIARVPLSLSGRGAFTAKVPITNLPRDYYMLDLIVDGQVADSRWLSVDDIVKPAYQLKVETDLHAFLDGDPLAITIRATFFDGTAVPGVDVRVRASEGGGRVTVTTDAEGVARTTLRASFPSHQPAGFNHQSISVRPARPEEGQIYDSTSVVVFPSTAWLTMRAALDRERLTIQGTLTRVELDELNAAYDPESWRWPSGRVADGRPLGGHTITARVTQIDWVRRQTGTRYDYIEKRVVQIFDWDEVETNLGTFEVETGSEGRYRLSLPVPSASSSYEIHLRATDADGRPVVNGDYVSARRYPSEASRRPFLIRGFCGQSGSTTVGLDEAASLTFHNANGSPAEGRFLWLVANRGLRDVATSGAPNFSHTMRTADLPRFTVRGVQVTSEGYATADASVHVDLDDLTIRVSVIPDRERYAPGERARVEVRTTGPDGRPIAADVVVQGIDEKLYAIGAASRPDVLNNLHRWVSDGFLQSFASHRIPSWNEEGGCGATGGGGPARSDFGDVVTFQLVTTGADGRGTASFDLRDDLTSWRITAMAVSRDLKAGVGSTLLPVSLPFFVESVLATEYLAGEVPILRLRAYGDALGADDAVRFTLNAPSLGVEDQTVDGVSFQAARITLPALTLGKHRVRIDADGPGDRHDAVIRFINVIPSRLETLVAHYDELTEGFVPQGGDGLTTYTISDAGRGSLIKLLADLAQARSGRFDRLAAAAAARQILIDDFGFDERELPPVDFDASAFEDNGISLLRYSSRDPELSAMAALLVPGSIDTTQVRRYLSNLQDNGKTTREVEIMVLAARAGLGDDVLTQLRAMAEADLTIREWLWLALGLAAAGDENGARNIERALLDDHGERLGPWVRLRVGNDVIDTESATRLLLVLSARLGESFAPDVAAYLSSEVTGERSVALEMLAYAQAMLERMPRTATRFAWTVDGERHEERLRPGGSMTIVVTPEQRATFRLEPLKGQVAVVTTHRSASADLPSGDLATISRTITPGPIVNEHQLVHVVITVTFGSQATDECWRVTDVVPSGLAPISWWGGGGQRVWGCISRDDPDPISYTARVVSPGTYTWEPAIVQSPAAPEVGDATEPFEFRIR
jgi:hypothetical protein